MKKIFLMLFLMFLPLFAVDIHMEKTKTDLYCSLNETNLTFVKKDTILATLLIENRCSTDKVKAEAILAKTKHTLFVAFISKILIHGTILLLAVASIFYMLKKKLTKYYPFLGVSIFIILLEVPLLFLNFNIIVYLMTRLH